MKSKKKLIKKVAIVATLTVGVIELSSIFNQTQATAWYFGKHREVQGIYICDGNGFDCLHPFTIY